nr:uncharacterized protein LOC122590003 isoform X2 [Erigeron canadensis]
MRNQNIYWNDKVNEYLRSNINEDNEEISFLFDKRDDIVFVISCLEDMHPQFNLRDKPLPPFVFVKKDEVEQLSAEIRDSNNRHMLLLKKEWEERYEDDFWQSLKANLDKVVNLEESSMYWYAPKPDMDPYEYMDCECTAGT